MRKGNSSRAFIPDSCLFDFKLLCDFVHSITEFQFVLPNTAAYCKYLLNCIWKFAYHLDYSRISGKRGAKFYRRFRGRFSYVIAKAFREKN